MESIFHYFSCFLWCCNNSGWHEVLGGVLDEVVFVTVDFHNVDCMDLMKDKPDNHYDLAIVDPPYGINASKMTMGVGSRNDTGKNTAKDWDEKPPSFDYFVELKRVSNNQVIWGGNYFLDNLPGTRCFLMWDKMDYNSDFASHELAWTSFDKNTKCFRRARNKGDEIKIHPTQKPVDLYRWLLKNYAKEGDRIIDTHGGSMSIAIACHEMGFDLDICELDKEYYNAALERFDKAADQVRMF